MRGEEECERRGIMPKQLHKHLRCRCEICTNNDGIEAIVSIVEGQFRGDIFAGDAGEFHLPGGIIRGEHHG